MVAWLRAWTVAGLFLVWLVAELLAAFVPALRMRTLTRTVVAYLPYPVTAAVVGWLVTWLPAHFVAYYKRKEVDMTLDPNQPQPAEPLLTRAGIVSGVTAAIDLGVAFGLHLSTAQDVAILGVTNAIVVPLVVALWARRSVFSPATVARIMRAKNVAANPPKAGP